MRRGLLWLLGLLLIGGSPAAAQTAEETVAFLLLGVEDAAPARVQDMELSEAGNWKQTGDAPLTFGLRGMLRGAKSGEQDVELSVALRQTAPCVFEVRVTPVKFYWMWMSRVSFDFNKVRGIEEFQVLKSRQQGGGARSIRFDAAPGFCVYETEGKMDRCMGNFVHHLAHAEERRVRAAFAHLRQRYCAGRAF